MRVCLYEYGVCVYGCVFECVCAGVYANLILLNPTKCLKRIKYKSATDLWQML